jgi:hypothetical protein
LLLGRNVMPNVNKRLMKPKLPVLLKKPKVKEL